MENRKLIDRDEIYFLVFFSNFFIGMLLLTIKYNFDSIQAFFVFANIDPIPFFFLFIVFIACLYYFNINHSQKTHSKKNINFIKNFTGFIKRNS